MAVDRTAEFGQLLPSSSDRTAGGEVRQRRRGVGFLSGLFPGTGSPSDEQKLFSVEFAAAAASLLSDIDNSSSTLDSLARLRDDIDALEADIEVASGLAAQVVEHHRVVLLVLKQRLGRRERKLVGAAGVTMRRQRPERRLPTEAVVAVQGVPTMTESELVEQYRLSPEQLQALQQSAQALLEQHSQFSQELSSVNAHIVGIARLQRVLGEQLEWQEALGERLLDEADSSMGVVRKGNVLLERVAGDSGLRNLVVAVFAVLSLLLILFDWLN